ncbi:MAG: condensin subunit ScpA [Candidatus Hecatellales archaeon B24]|nr:MAG: condensin subunit ScpA [Candidatus Hecatellales archaeon B24]
MSSEKKPFWLKPPWQVLFDLARLSKVRPWDLNIATLLSSFLKEMKQMGYVDFNASGTALLSSSIVLRLQSERIFEAEIEEEKKGFERIFDYVPPPLQLPFRFELTVTGLEDILAVLDEVLKAEKAGALVKVKRLEPPPGDLFTEYDKMVLQWEQQLETFYDKLKASIPEGEVLFSKLAGGLPWKEIVKIFLMLIFMASKGLVELYQAEEFSDIKIVLKSKAVEGESRLET